MYKYFLPLIFLSLSLTIYPRSPLAQTSTSCSGTDKYSVTVQTNQGLLTAADNNLISSKFSFNDKCITSNRALIPQFGIPTYLEMRSIFYEQAKTISGKVNKQPKLVGGINHQQIVFSGNDAHIYWVNNGDLTIGGGISGNPVRLLFIDGNLLINQNITSGNGNAQGLVFIVQGDINIAPTVTNIDAVLIVYGNFCSGFSAGSCPSPIEAPKLTIRGSVMYLNPDTSTSPKFVRTRDSVVNNEPAEDLIYDPKYLVILNNIMTRTLSVWTENQ